MGSSNWVGEAPTVWSSSSLIEVWPTSSPDVFLSISLALDGSAALTRKAHGQLTGCVCPEFPERCGQPTHGRRVFLPGLAVTGTGVEALHA